MHSSTTIKTFTLNHASELSIKRNSHDSNGGVKLQETCPSHMMITRTLLYMLRVSRARRCRFSN